MQFQQWRQWRVWFGKIFYYRKQQRPILKDNEQDTMGDRSCMNREKRSLVWCDFGRKEIRPKAKGIHFLGVSYINRIILWLQLCWHQCTKSSRPIFRGKDWPSGVLDAPGSREKYCISCHHLKSHWWRRAFHWELKWRGPQGCPEQSVADLSRSLLTPTVQWTLVLRSQLYYNGCCCTGDNQNFRGSNTANFVSSLESASAFMNLWAFIRVSPKISNLLLTDLSTTKWTLTEMEI